MESSKFPTDAEVVIVGVGGIVGSMLAYWLTELGQKNIVGLEKSTIIPSDIASTAHASDFVYNTTHDKLGCWTTNFSRKFYEDNGFFLKKGGPRDHLFWKKRAPLRRFRAIFNRLQTPMLSPGRPRAPRDAPGEPPGSRPASMLDGFLMDFGEANGRKLVTK